MSSSEEESAAASDPSQSQAPPPKPLNAFQLLGGILAAAVGIRSARERSREFALAGTGTIILAVLIFSSVGYALMKLFVHLVKSAAGQ